MVSGSLIPKIISQAQTSASHSWEYGTVFEALLEYHNPSLSIFNNPFPNGKIPTVYEHQVPALRYVKPFILTDSDQLCEGNGSSSDPTSLAIPALLLSPNSLYLPAATRQLTHLFTSVPRFPNGALSHRDAYPSLWADFTYMVPPFLAYYSVFVGNQKYMHEAVRQCELYSKLLETENGCWRHIVNAEEGEGRKKDEGLWSTGNGWAAAGMARVLATVRKSSFVMENAEKVLVGMIQRIIDGAMTFDSDPSGLLRNRLDDETWFGEAAGTAMLAAAVFRMAVLEPSMFGERYTRWAVGKMEVVGESIDTETGIVGPVVIPTKDEHRAPLDGVSPEAQAFVVLMYAAWKDWKGVVEAVAV